MHFFEQSAHDEIIASRWVRHIEWFAEIDSTNIAARHYLLNCHDPLLPSLFVAQKQTAGRGRGGRKWWSPTGCLMFTLALPSDAIPNDSTLWSQLALVCGHAVARTAAAILPSESVQLKWPNDVYVRGKKLAGILIESATGTDGDRKPCWLVGIGLNVHVDWSNAPEDVAQKATCLSSLALRPLDLKVVLVELLEELQGELLRWTQGDPTWLTQWRERCLLSGKVVHVRQAPQYELIGVCEGLDSSGRLIVRDEQNVQFLTTGEVVDWQ